ncbi:radical SAM protein [[Eubacterium] cellulosolvens]
MRYEYPVYRPPSEWKSLIIQATIGCPHNKCGFCDMYKTQKFRLRPLQEIKKDIEMAKELELKVTSNAASKPKDAGKLAYAAGIPWLLEGEVRSVFIADSNSIIMATKDLAELLRFIRKTFPNLDRVTSYARADTILAKSLAELKTLREAGLDRLHVGLETGDPELLKIVKKGVTPEEQVKAGRKALKAGFELTEYVLLGLGGKEYWEQHAIGTAKVLNQINPTWVRVRTLMLRPKTILYIKMKRGEFHETEPLDVVRETRLLLENLDCKTEFLSDHNSNYLPLNGRLPEEKQKMLEYIDETLETVSLVPGAEQKIFPPNRIRHL